MSAGALPQIFPGDLGPLVRSALFKGVLPPALPDEIDWDAELPAVVDQRLAACALKLLADRQIPVPAAAREALQGSAFAWTARTMRVLRASAEGVAAVAGSGIPAVVTKGAGIAVAEGRVQERPFSDVDVMVGTRHFERALEILTRLGYGEERRNRQPRTALNRWCREAINLARPDGASIDLHHHVPPWIWGRQITVELLEEHSQLATQYGGTFPVASPEANLLIAALHVVSDRNAPGRNLMTWRDVAVLGHAVDPAKAAALAEATGLGGWLSWILGCLPEPARPAGLLASLAALPGSIGNRRRLVAILGEQRAHEREVQQLLRLPLANGALFALGMLAPSRAFLRSRPESLGYRAWWARLLRS